MPLDRFVAVAFLAKENMRAIGANLERVYPIDQTPAFAELLEAIEEADRERRRDRQ